jgi:DNA polymerase-3 subunit gamma/tau
MSYQVLARKWRPRNFSEMVGQEHVLRALINALDNDRLHHAFLFTGTRGVGKTTIARILAKSLNCEEGVSSTPCGKCSSCNEIDEGRFIDLIEVDAASRTKVEDTRELLENVQYAPTRGRYKVYLIDEVHMLSNHSFNALLKTLEEPPPHVKFLLATTDPQKLPVTILSRCLQFNLKQLPVKLIADYLNQLMSREGIQYEEPAIQTIARAAEGSMRDALSLLDQAIAHGGGKLQETEVRDMLGSIEQHYVTDLLSTLSTGDGQKLLEVVEQLAEKSPDYASVLGELISFLHRVALAQVVPDTIDDSYGDKEQVLELADTLLPEDVQLYYQIGLLGRRDLPLAPDPRSGLEMVLLRMLAFRPVPVSAKVMNVPIKEREPSKRESVAGTVIEKPSIQAQEKSITVPDTRNKTEETTVPINEPITTEKATDTDWNTIVPALGLKAAAKELAQNCVYGGKNGDVIKLVLDKAYEQIHTKSASKRLEKALQQYYNEPVKVEIKIQKLDEAETPAKMQERLERERHQDAVRTIEQDPIVKDLQDVFNADLSAERIRPSD